MSAPDSVPVDLFGQMNALAASLDAVNLGHGYAEDPALDVLVEGAAAAIREGRNHYSPSEGLLELRETLARRCERRGLSYEVEEITVTAGCSEALAAALIAVVEAGSEVVTLEPFYDLYPDMVEFAGARLVPVSAPELGGSADSQAALVEAVSAAITPATRALLLNSPHNPTGLVLSRASLERLGALAIEHDLVVLADDVYEELVYDGEHIPIAGLDGMRARTIACSSVTKTLSMSGWRVGWAYAPPELTGPLRDAHRALTFCAPTPLQAAVAAALEWADETAYFNRLRSDYAARRDLLVEGLRAAGLEVVSPSAGYFVVADVRSWSGGMDVREFAVRLAHDAGVVAIPLTTSVSSEEAGQNLLRFAFCKSEPALREACRRLRRYAEASR